MHVGVGFFGGGNFIFSDGELEIHVEYALVELDGFFGVVTSIGNVMDSL